MSPSWRQQQDEDEDGDRRRRNEDAAGQAALRWAETLFELGLGRQENLDHRGFKEIQKDKAET